MTTQELYLYRLTADVKDYGQIHVIVLSPTDDKAFEHAEKELERYTISTPQVKEWNLEEKKRVHSGIGYVIESNFS